MGGSVAPGEEVDVTQLVSSHDFHQACAAAANAAHGGHRGLAVELAQLKQGGKKTAPVTPNITF